MKARSLWFFVLTLWLVTHVHIALADNETKLRLQIHIPNQLGSIVVDKSNYNDIVNLLGKAEFVEHEISKVTQIEFLRVRYPRLGIEFSIDKNKQMRVIHIEVYRPFKSKTTEGIFVGMSISTARDIMVKKYGKPTTEFGGYMHWDIPNIFAIKYENGFVVAIKMLGRLQ